MHNETHLCLETNPENHVAFPPETNYDKDNECN